MQKVREMYNSQNELGHDIVVVDLEDEESEDEHHLRTSMIMNLNRRETEIESKEVVEQD